MNKKIIIFITIIIAVIAVFAIGYWGAGQEPSLVQISKLDFRFAESDLTLVKTDSNGDRILELTTLINENQLTYKVYIDITPKKHFVYQGVVLTAKTITGEEVVVKIEYDITFKVSEVMIVFDERMLKAKGVAHTIRLDISSANGVAKDKIYLNFFEEEESEMT